MGSSTTRQSAPTPTITLVLPSLTSDHSTRLRPHPPPFTPSSTPLPTDTLQPTPAYAVITSPSGGGANVRSSRRAGPCLTVIERHHRPGAAGNTECWQRHTGYTSAWTNNWKAGCCNRPHRDQPNTGTHPNVDTLAISNSASLVALSGH